MIQLRSLIQRITRRVERRGERRYVADDDPDIRKFRRQRRESERITNQVEAAYLRRRLEGATND